MFTLQHAFLIPVADAEEARQHCINLRSLIIVSGERLFRHSIRGISPSRIDFLFPHKFTDLYVYCEVGIKTGRYTDENRVRIALRNSSPPPSAIGAELRILSTEHAVTITCDGHRSDPPTFQLELPRLSQDMVKYDLPRIIVWNYERFYYFLPRTEISALADKLSALYPDIRTWTLAEANFVASTELTALARYLGYQKLTTQQQRALGLNTPWHHQSKLAKLRSGNLAGKENE